MLRLVVLAAALVSVLGAPRVPVIVGEDRIVGAPEVDIEDAPYQLLYLEFDAVRCGASIISVDWAVTAAYCAYGSRPNVTRLISGNRIQYAGVNHPVSVIIIHEQYDTFTIDFDVAVMRVTVPFVFDATTAIIPLASTAPAAGTLAFVTGWGITEDGGEFWAAILRGIEVPIYDQEACKAAYADYRAITDRMICAGFEEGGYDRCKGDTGGPLVANGELVGIISWGRGCGRPGYPGVYANVAVLREWIVEHAQ